MKHGLGWTGWRFSRWREGDTVTLNVHNKGTTSHGLDTHAFKIDARKYGPTLPGTTLKIEKVVETPGVFMYHCAAGPVAARV